MLPLGRRIPWLVLPLLASSCFSTLPYTPDPARIPNPSAEIAAIMAANPTPGRRESPEVVGDTLVIHFVCESGVPDVDVVRCSHVTKVEVQELEGAGAAPEAWGPAYGHRLRVTHDDGTNVPWGSASLASMQRLADAITALCGSASTPRAAPPP